MMLDPIQIVQDVETLLDEHYTDLVARLPQPTTPAPLTPPLATVKPTGVTELLGNLAFLFVLSVLDQSLTRTAAR